MALLSKNANYNQKGHLKMNYKIAYQAELSYPGLEIKNHKDYFKYRNLIERIDELLKHTNMDLHFADKYISRALKKNQNLIIISMLEFI